MYARVKAHPGTRDIYARQLIREGVITEDELGEMTKSIVDKYEGILARAKQIASEKTKKKSVPTPIVELDGSEVLETGTARETLDKVSEKISIVPEGFQINPKMVGQLGRRAKMGSGEVPMDWGFAETVAYASLIDQGYGLHDPEPGRGDEVALRRRPVELAQERRAARPVAPHR